MNSLKGWGDGTVGKNTCYTDLTVEGGPLTSTYKSRVHVHTHHTLFIHVMYIQQ